MAPNPASQSRPTLSPAVHSLLDGLRRRLRRYIWLEGSAAALAWLGAAFWLSLAIDWFFEPAPAARIVLLAIFALVLAAVLFRLIGRRIFVPVSDGNAAMLIERRFPSINDSLLTAVVLTSKPTGSIPWDASSSSDDISILGGEMLERTCREADQRIGDVDVREVFNPRPLRRNWTAAIALIVSVGLFAVVFPAAFGIWASRALALSEELWPRNTRLEIVGFKDGQCKVARGTDLEIVAKADTRMPQVPQTVQIRYRTEGGGRGRATMDRRGASRGDDDHFQEYAYVFRGMLSDVNFNLVGGDARLGPYQILVVDSPSIGQMTLHCQLPSYIRRRQPPLPVSGVMQVPMGSRVTIRAADANKELVDVRVQSVYGDRPAPEPPLPCELSKDRRGFVHVLERLDKDVTMLFTLTDVDGISGREPTRLVLVAAVDQPPQMAVQLDGIGTSITPNARLPIAGGVSDDYGLARLWFEHSVNDHPPGEHLIADLPDAPAKVNLNGETAALEVRELGLKPGSKLLLCVKAADLRDLGQGPNVAAGERWLLEVVPPEQLRAMLEARELVLRQRYEQIIQEVVETRDLLARLDFSDLAKPQPTDGAAGKAQPSAATPAGSEPGDEEPADSPQRQRSLRLLRVQGALGNSRKNGQEVLGVAESFEDIIKQMINNRIDTEEMKTRLDSGIARPLRLTAETSFPELDRRIEALLADLDDLQRSPALRDRALRQAEEVLLEMHKVLERMLELESFNEAVELLQNIVDMQKKLQQETEQRHKDKIRDLLKE
jgi:hypothetical protein